MACIKKQKNNGDGMDRYTSRIALIVLGLCLQTVVWADTNEALLNKPAELFFSDAPPEFKSTGSRKDGDEAIQDSFDEAVLAAIRNGDLKYLETTAAALAKDKSMTPSGYLRLGLFYDAIWNSAKDKSVDKHKIDAVRWSKALETVSNWQRAYPDSAFAPVAMVELHMFRAWSLRGQGYASEVPPEQWARFNKEVSRATEILLGATAAARTNPIWYGSYIDIAKFSSMDHDTYVRVIEEALKTHPEFLSVAVNGVDYLLPRWGGSDKAVRDYIYRIVSLVRKEDAPILYARFYRRLLRQGFYDSTTVVQLAAASPSRLKRDYDELVRRYPDPSNEDAEAATLCGIGDKEGLRKLLVTIGDSPIQREWSHENLWTYFLSCRQYASQQ